jgi:hypothetical protein
MNSQMRQLSFITITITITLLSSCSSYRFKNSKAPLIEGTTWVFSSKYRTYEITFEKGGRISSTHQNDNTPENDFWKQDGMVLNFYFNDKYSSYKGKFKREGLIRGTATSKKGKWKWTLERKK